MKSLVLKKSISIMVIMAMMVTMFSNFSIPTASANVQNVEIEQNNEIALDSNLEGEFRKLTPEELEQYLLTGKLNDKQRFVPIVVGGAAFFWGAVIEAIVAASVSAAIAFGVKYVTNVVRQSNVKSVKVSYATFDPNDYKTWVCDTCVNSSFYVELTQRVLTGLAFSIGTVDGRWGPLTKSGVIAFQRVAGITQDGAVGPATWAKFATK